MVEAYSRQHGASSERYRMIDVRVRVIMLHKRLFILQKLQPLYVGYSVRGANDPNKI